MYTTLYLGPVQSIGYNLAPAWTSAPAPGGTRAFTLSGTLPVAPAEQLSELVANDARRVTIGGQSGVLEYVFMDGGVSRDFNGWCLFDRYDFTPYRLGDGVKGADFTLSAVHLGPQRQPVVVHSGRDLDNDYDLDGTPILAQPLTAGVFLTDPGGTRIVREFDPLPCDPARTTSDIAEMEIYIDPTAAVVAVAPTV